MKTPIMLLCVFWPWLPTALAQPANVPEPAVEFQMASDVLPQGEVTLSNGIVVSPSDWKTLILASIPKTGRADEQASTCTGTLVGPKAVLIAAHCVDNPLGLTARKAVLSVAGRQAVLTCEIHPTYLALEPKFREPRGSEDYALCAIDYRGPVPASVAGLEFEVLDASTLAPRGSAALMTGFGCSELRVQGGQLDWDKSDRLLRIGDGRIDAQAGTVPGNPSYLTIRSDNARGPAVCPGDSGGPLFTGATTGAPAGPRRVIGVNSAVATQRRPDQGYDLISRIAALGNPSFRNWASGWASRNQATAGVVCGVTRNAGRSPCRD